MIPFFVYGTLLPDQPNAFLWQNKVATMQSATLQGGVLYDMGNFPMLVLGEGDEPVVGMILVPNIEHHAELMAGLDQLEGYNSAKPEASVYRRVQHRVQLAGGSVVVAWVYAGSEGFIAGISPITPPDWIAHVAHKSKQVQEWWVNFESLFPDS